MLTRIGEEILTSLCRAIFAPWVSRVIIGHPIQSELASSLTVTIAVISYPHSSPRLYFAPSTDIATVVGKSLGVSSILPQKGTEITKGVRQFQNLIIYIIVVNFLNLGVAILCF